MKFAPDHIVWRFIIGIAILGSGIFLLGAIFIFLEKDSFFTLSGKVEKNTQNMTSSNFLRSDSVQNPVQKILISQDSPISIAKRLTLKLPELPPEGQIEAVRHIVRLLTDDEYQLAAEIYKDHRTPEAIRAIIYQDFMNRSNAIKLPLLIQTLQSPANPLYEDAIKNLQLFVGYDAGNAPAQWEIAVKEKLNQERNEQPN
jgi:hypothetical protein